MTTREQGKRPMDYPLIVIVAALLTVGLMMVYSSTFAYALEEYSDATHYLRRQLLWLLIGLASCLVVSRLEYHLWPRVSVSLMVGTLVLLVLVLFIGEEIHGSRRALIGTSVQPSELAKLTVVIYVAHWLSSKGKKIRQLTYGLIPFSVLVGLVAALIILQPDFGTAALIVLTAGAMFYLAGADLLQLAGAFAVAVAAFVVTTSRFDYVSERITSYTAALRDPISGSGWQLSQALMALGAGGLFGQGLGQGHVNLVLPHTDSVFALLGEELGFIGCLLVIGLYAGLAYRGFLIASQASDDFGALLAAGITCWLIFQALINAAVVTGLTPFTGISLPFISLGGSSLVTCLSGVGLLLSVSRGSIEKGKTKSANLALGRRDRRPRLSRTSRRRRAG
ncbi:MAG: putative lipid II flippase FtsW [Chloroflexota bacterium]|nr:putative lipid II flippase FtsW [Chloroflexota bacterium]